MTQWFVLYKKELLEMVRNYKILWIPLVFILLGVMQPVSSYYLPQILDTVGGLPEGTVIEMPMPTGPQVLTEVLSNYGLLGILIIVLSGMGIVSAERQSGVAGMIMIKPVPHFSYISSKWAGFVSITLLSLYVGYGASWYYTNLLIEKVAFQPVLQSVAFFSVWLIFVVTLTVLFSTLMKGNGSIAFLTIIVVAAVSLATSIAKKYMKWSPAMMNEHAGAVLNLGELQSSFSVALIFTIAIIISLLFLSVQIFKQKELLE